MFKFIKRARRPISEALHLSMAAMALATAFLLRFEFVLDSHQRNMLLSALPWAMLLKFIVFRGFSLRDLAWRYLGFEDLLRIAWANTVASLALSAVLRMTVGSGFPRSIYVLDWLLCAACLLLARASARVAFSPVGHSLHRNGRRARGMRSILIYGAGQAGRRVLAELRAHPEMRLDTAGFIDDDLGKRHLRLGGTRVLGGRVELPDLVKKHGVMEIWLALPTASGGELASILERCHSAGVTTKRIPPLAELIESKVLLDQLREVRIEDLLGRPPVQLEQGTLGESLRGKVVLVTGAGGSIGSELCRQIARARPRALIGLDHGETALYQIDNEIRELFPELVFKPEIANIQNQIRLNEIFREHKPDRVYHAAAYKHVPMMEAHLFEAIENNVFGTFNVARAASENGAEAFVLISSDKAVRPSNIMGATKRLAELVCMAANARGGATRFLAVRFGNVLGSNGSVIPLFRRQIAAGGPVTVTHPEMRRYFMTIPEAVQLVLQAAELGSGGEIFVLDMGEPIKILDLARKLVLLSGLRPDKDIRIEFSGVRPGEKLFEELQSEGEEARATPHPKIRVFGARSVMGAPFPAKTPLPDFGENYLDLRLAALRRSVAERDWGGSLLCCKEMIPDYNPSSGLLRRALEERTIDAEAFAEFALESARGKAANA